MYGTLLARKQTGKRRKQRGRFRKSRQEHCMSRVLLGPDAETNFGESGLR